MEMSSFAIGVKLKLFSVILLLFVCYGRKSDRLSSSFRVSPPA